MRVRIFLLSLFLILAAGSGTLLLTTPPVRAFSSLETFSTTAPVAPSLLTQVQPNQISVLYTFQNPVVQKIGKYDRVVLPGLPNHGEPGAPVLPVQTVKILLPPDTEPEDIQIIPGEHVTLEGNYLVEPGQEFVPSNSPPELEPILPNPAIYESATPYPGQLYTLVSVQKLTGYTILLLNLYPVQYTPQPGELAYYQSLTVNVTTKSPAQLGPMSAHMLRNTPEDEQRVRAMVANPQTLDTYPDASASADDMISVQGTLVYPAEPADYIIITSNALSSTFRVLANWKESKGLTTQIFSTEDIYANYAGSDDAEKLRNFIVDAYATWSATAHPLKYVALGGDTEIIPIRSVYIKYGGYTTWMPVDMYYAGLDGNWDKDGDGNYGESAGAGTAGEEIDFFAEVYVGRLPVETPAEVANIVNKIIDYEQNPTADYLDKALWLGRELDARTWGGNAKDLVSNLIPQYNVTALYNRDGTYNTNKVIAEMNAGKHLVNFNGHGNQSCCPLTQTQIQNNLTNTDYFLFFNEGCYTAYFDWSGGEAVAEHYVFEEHGAFAYIGNTRYGWYSPGSTNGPGDKLDRLFFDFAVNTNNHHIGQALQLAKEEYYPGQRWSILTLSLFGDPETPLVTKLPVPVANISEPKGGSTIKFTTDIVGTATAGDAPGATFDQYLVEYGAGINPGSWTQIGSTSTNTVTNNLLTTWDTTTTPDDTYTLRLIVDDGAGKTSIDRDIIHLDNLYLTTPTEDQLIRGGDLLTITGSALGTDFLDYVVEYGQGATPGSWTVIASSTTPMTDSVLAVWNTSVISEPDDYTLRLTRHGTVHNSTARVTIYIDPAWQAGWPQEINNRIVAPSLAAGDIDGDGDMEIVATTSMYDKSSYVYAWHHDGTPVDGWSWPKWAGSKRASAPILADIDRDGDREIILGAGNQVYAWHHNGDDVFGWPRPTTGEVFASPSVADLNGDGYLEIVATSFDQQVYIWHHNGATMAGWPQSVGYKLYASPALGDLDGDGDFEIVTARKGAVYAWHHNGAAVTGWPLAVPAIISDVVASPALGNIAGDNNPEIILGAGDQVYAWHHNGASVTGWPQTAGGTIQSSPALGDLDGINGLEVVIGAGQVYAWHGNGAAVAGWPVALTEYSNASPVLGDITGNGEIDVVIGAGDTDEHIYAWQRDGTPLTGWPRWVPAFDGVGSHYERLASPLLTDLDQDGDIEIAIGAEQYVLIYDLAAAYNQASLEWPIYQHDLQFTGWYTSGLFNLPPFVQDVKANPGYVIPGHNVTITAKVTDEDGVSSVTAQIESPDEAVLVTLTLYDDGAHNDGAAGDDLYGNLWTTPSVKQDYFIDLGATDNLGKSYLHNNIGDFTSKDVAYVQYAGHVINQEDLQLDGIVSPGEFIQGAMTLENIGVFDALGITATLSTDDPCLWNYNLKPLTFGDIAAGHTAASDDTDFFFLVNNLCPHNHVVTFDLNIYDTTGQTWTDAFEITVIDNLGPDIFGAQTEPRDVFAGQPVTITVSAQDSSGIASIQAMIESPDEIPIATLTLYDDGAHGDWRAGDGTYGTIWTTTTHQRIYEVDFATEDTLSNTRAYNNKTSFTTQSFSKSADILLVTDGGGWLSTGEFRPHYTTALDDIGVEYDLWDNYFYGKVLSETLQLYTGGAIVWAVSDWGDVNVDDTQTALQAYLDAGGKLFISGQNLGSYSGRTTFYSDYIHAGYTREITETFTLDGTPGDPIGDDLHLTLSKSEGPFGGFLYPDGIAPLAPGTTVFTYTGSAMDSAGGIRVDEGNYKIVYFSYGFDKINNADDRAIVMERVLTWLLGPLSAPEVNFIAAPTFGASPLTVVFTNTSDCTYTTALWDFGDNLTSTLDSPMHTYLTPGTYTVTFTLSGTQVYTKTRPAYIIVEDKQIGVYLPLILRD